WFQKKRDFFAPEDLNEDLIADWKSLNTDDDAEFEEVLEIDAADITQMVSYGLTLNEIVGINDPIGEVSGVHPNRAHLELPVGTIAKDITFHHAFIGSCTNGRVEDFEDAARVVKLHGGKIKVQSALAVPGSIEVKRECEAKGLDKIFTDAGFEWREPGCSSCLAMNPDKFDGRVASSTNRNFPGRQGPASRTYLMSPESVALAALEGVMTDIVSFNREHGGK
ncbi:MAG: 3-isopropylmalate dehydratase large subunit, partial [Planctomycetes bacterium]|nr:3-isopropylmalate dehydratase large subunit [Planctomycetota bacterium]